MTLADAVEEILTRCDESFVGVSEDRARRMFYVALTQILREGKFQDTDAFGFIIEREHTFGVGVNTCDLSDFESSDEVLAIRGDFFFTPEFVAVGQTYDTYITKATTEEIRKWGMTGLRPVYNRMYFQTGDTFNFYPSDVWNDVTISANVIIAPLPYADGGGAEYWTDTTELTDVMTTAFENSIIETSAQLLKQEVIVNDG